MNFQLAVNTYACGVGTQVLVDKENKIKCCSRCRPAVSQKKKQILVAYLAAHNDLSYQLHNA